MRVDWKQINADMSNYKNFEQKAPSIEKKITWNGDHF